MTYKNALFATAALAMLLGTACNKKQDRGAEQSLSRQTRTNQPGTAQAPGQAPRKAVQTPGMGHDDHAHDQAPPPRAVLPPDGHLGDALTIEKVTPLQELLANPKSFAGKDIRVSGKVVAMCRHRRAWFALGDDKGRPVVMIRTAPKFFVPPTVMGMTAVAEGTVQLKTFPRKMAAHLAEEHKLFGADPKAIDGPRVLVTLQAKGTIFSPKKDKTKVAPRK